MLFSRNSQFTLTATSLITSLGALMLSTSASAGPIADAYARLDDQPLYATAKENGVGKCKIEIFSASRMGLTAHRVLLDGETLESFNGFNGQDPTVEAARYVRQLIIDGKCTSL